MKRLNWVSKKICFLLDMELNYRGVIQFLFIAPCQSLSEDEEGKESEVTHQNQHQRNANLIEIQICFFLQQLLPDR